MSIRAQNDFYWIFAEVEGAEEMTCSLFFINALEKYLISLNMPKVMSNYPIFRTADFCSMEHLGTFCSFWNHLSTCQMSHKYMLKRCNDWHLEIFLSSSRKENCLWLYTVKKNVTVWREFRIEAERIEKVDMTLVYPLGRRPAVHCHPNRI